MASDPGAGHERKATGADFEKTLQHAERLLDGVDSSHRRIAMVRALSTAFLAVTILAIGLFASLSGDILRASIAAGEGLLWVIVIVVLMLSWIALLRRQLRRDELNMIDLINMLRELHPLVADEEKWSYTQNQLTQARLERFPIGVEDPGPRRKSR